MSAKQSKGEVDNQEIDENKLEHEQVLNGFSLQYKLIIDESNNDSPVSIWFSTIELCNEKFRNTDMYSTASINSDSFEVNAISYIQDQNSFGGEFTCYQDYIFDRYNTEKLYCSLCQTIDLVLISEIVKQKFGGLSGLKTLEVYCKDNGINYDYKCRYQE